MRNIKRLIIAKQLNTQLFHMPIIDNKTFKEWDNKKQLVSTLIGGFKYREHELNSFFYSW